MRVLLVNDFYAPHVVGGAETLVHTLALNLIARGHTVAVCTARIGDLPAHFIDEDGIQVYRIGHFPAYKRSVAIASGTAPSRPSRETIMGFDSVLDTFQPDSIHFHNAWLLGPALIRNASVRGGQVGVTLHDYWPVCVRRSMIRVNWQPCPGPEPFNCKLCRLRAPSTWRSFDIFGIEREMAEHAEILGGCKFVTAPSRFVAERVSAGIKKQVTVLPNGVVFTPNLTENRNALEPHALSPDGMAGPYVLFASRPTIEKGYGIALEAFSQARLKDYTLAVAGDPPRRKGDIRSNVTILGKQPAGQMMPLIAGASCVIVPSTWPENCPMIILEALSAGVPVVASSIGGIPELVEDGITGILVKPSDVDGLADAVARACTDESLQASARHAGPAVVRERFSMDIMVSHLEELYAA